MLYRCNSSSDELATRLKLTTRQQWWPAVYSVESLKALELLVGITGQHSVQKAATSD